MNTAPILILQMQRMGDLVLSFPLLGWLGRLFPDHPLWVVGERAFFEPLMPLSPKATYFSYGSEQQFSGIRFHSVINLSHRPEAAALASKVRSDSLFGSSLDSLGRLYINGNWQLYRTSLTHNNRYNLYHWADLNALDIIPADTIRKTLWPPPRPFSKTIVGNAGARIGLFLGASEPDKRPDADFWAQLTRIFLDKGQKPVLLGGKAELPIGNAVAGMLKLPALNLCGRFDIKSLARFLSELDLLVTPDTGPMHIASWAGTPVLNLSLGPVNPWETGPFSSGHHIVRADLECTGCWRCICERPFCRDMVRPALVAKLAARLLAGQKTDARAFSLRGLELLRSGRDSHGLYTLESLNRGPMGENNRQDCAETEETAEERAALSRFWKAWFGCQFGIFTPEEEGDAWREFQEQSPEAALGLKESAAGLLRDLARDFRSGAPKMLTEPDAWRHPRQALHPFSGYLQMYAQNTQDDEESRTAQLHILSLAEQLAALP